MSIAEHSPFMPWYWNHSDLFAGVDQRARGDFLAASECLEFKRGRHIFRARDPAAYAYFLQRGIVKIYDLTATGSVTLFWFCIPGDILGPGAITGTEEQAVYAQVVSDATVLAIKRADLEQVLSANPQLALNMVRLVGSRLRLVSEMMVDSQCLRAEERLARLLLRLAQNWGVLAPTGVQLPIHIPHQELANMIGSCRQTVNTILREFQSAGLLTVERRTITLTDTTSLQVRAALDSPRIVLHTKMQGATAAS